MHDDWPLQHAVAVVCNVLHLGLAELFQCLATWGFDCNALFFSFDPLILCYVVHVINAQQCLTRAMELATLGT